MFASTDKLKTEDGATKTMLRCKIAKVTNCQGRLVDVPEGDYVYWCGLRRNGWHAKPCEHYGVKK